MKTIRLTHIGRPDKGNDYIKNRMYSVFLGNGLKEYFTNLKDAKKFLADTNRYLNTRLHEVNQMYIEVFVHFRNTWFLIYSEDHDQETRFFKIEKKIKSSFNDIIVLFDKIVNHNKNANSNYYVFTWLFAILNVLLEIVNNLRTILLNRKYYSEIQKTKMLVNRINYLDLAIKAYGKDNKLKDLINKDLDSIEFL